MLFSYFLLHTLATENSSLVVITEPDRRLAYVPQHGIEYWNVAFNIPWANPNDLPLMDEYIKIKYSFDLNYSGQSITARAGRGFNTVIRDVDTNATSFFFELNMTNETFVATQEFEYISDDILKIITKVKNIADVPKRIDLGYYMDPSLAGNDKPIISILDGDKGIKFTQGDGKDFILVLKDGFGVTNVDHYYYGPTRKTGVFFATEEEINHTAEPGSFDAMLSFSYRNREILPGETVSFAQTLTVGVNVKLPPDFFFTDLKKVYPIGVESTLNGYYDSPEAGRILTLTKTLNGQPLQSDTFTTSDETKRKPFSINFTPNNGRGPYVLDVTVTDQFTQQYHQRVEFFANTAPTIEDHSNRDKDIYELSESVPINVKITDDTSATYVYQIDNGEKHYGKFVESNNEAKTFEFTIPVENLTLGQHSVVVTAIDADGTPASNSIPSFNFRVVKKPVITITTEDKPTYNIGENVTVNVTVDNQNSNTEITIYAKFGEGEFKPVTLNSPTAVFEIPYTAEEGPTTITFFAKDTLGQVTENKVISFEIKSIPLAPVVKIISTNKESYTIGESVTVKFSIFDYNKEDHANIMVRLGDANEFVLMMENVATTKDPKEYTVKVTGPNVAGDHNITLYAVDKDNLPSEHVQTLVKFNAAPPVVIPPGDDDKKEGGDKSGDNPAAGEGGKGNIIGSETDKDKDKDDDKLFPLWIVLAVLAACLLIIILALIIYFNHRKHEEEEEKNEDEKSTYPDEIPDIDDDMGSGESVDVNDSDVIPV